MSRIIHVFALFTVVALVAGRGLGAEDDLSVRDAWLRAPVMTGRPAAGYFMVENAGAGDHVLVGARIVAAERVEMHQHIMKDGRMMMRPVDEVVVPAKGSVVFKPHGYHLMVFGLDAVAPGDSVAITLEFAGHSPITVVAEVTATGAGAPHHNP